jgi:hypothetical protein
MAGKEPHNRHSLRALCAPKPGVSNKRKASAQSLVVRFCGVTAWLSMAGKTGCVEDMVMAPQ